ncbi:MAG: lysine--tRNA ligase [Candidatus Omnitrophota bacterium]
MELNEILQQRKTKLESLTAKGIACYESAPSDRITIAQALKDFKAEDKACLAGRIIAKRAHGKIIFLDIKDATGKIQLYLKSDFVGSEAFSLFENVDIADIITVRGELFKTHTGEPTVKVEKFAILAKALRPLPEKWHGLKDVELRYRQRYLDIIANTDVEKVFIQRCQIIKAIRNFLDERGVQEVETPMMHSIPGGASGRPFKTYHNEYGFELFLRIAPELYLKRLLVAGMDKVYEINRSFRNEGVSTRHNPEFTMLEVYLAYANYEDMMRLCQEMILYAIKEIGLETKFVYQDKTIDFTIPWQRLSFAGIVQEKFAISADDDAEVMLKKLQSKGFARDAVKLTRSQIGKIIEEILEQDMNMNPTFVTDYFTDLSPLAQSKKDNPAISERFELYIAGMEVGNAYSELNDPLEQKKRFEKEIKELNTDEQKSVDEDYCLALEHGMPPAGGLGIGIDRLVMLLTNQASIRDVILFPLLRSV